MARATWESMFRVVRGSYMLVRKFGHSCVLAEQGETRILFDPPAPQFLFDGVTAASFGRLTAVVVTHFHPDHCDPGLLRRLSPAPIYGCQNIVTELRAHGLEATEFQTGSRRIGDLALRACPAPHAAILGCEGPFNAAYLVGEELLVTGDSFDHALDIFRGVPLLTLPVLPPWANEIQIAEFAARMRPAAVVPVHDGMAKPFFLDSRYETFAIALQATDIRLVPLWTAEAVLDTAGVAAGTRKAE